MGATKKQRVHTLIVKVTFDKKCTRAHAVREARNSLGYGEYYTTEVEKSDPAGFKIRSVRAVGRSLKAVR